MELHTLLRIPVSEDLVIQLEAQARAAQLPLEEFIAKRLPQIQKSNSEKPIILTDTERQSIEKLVGKNISTGDELVRVVEHALSCTIGEVHVELTPRLLDRLRTRCLGMEFPRFLETLIRRELEIYCGLR